MGKIDNRQAYMEQLKAKAIKETEEVAKKLQWYKIRQRFGLFSQPPHLSLGEGETERKFRFPF